MLKNWRVTLGCLTLGCGLGLSPARAVVLNEILYDEDLGNADSMRAHEWIEIYNDSAAGVNLTGWKISNRGGASGAGARPLPAVVLPPGAYLVVHVTAGTNDLDFTDECGEYYTGDGAATDLFQDLMDECALYAPAGIVDFVAWARSSVAFVGGAAHDDAVAAGIWSSGSYLDSDHIVSAEFDKPRRVHLGTSIGRDMDSTDTNRSEDWDSDGGRDAHDLTRCERNLDELPLTVIPIPPPPTKNWTVMLYIDGDNNLERNAFDNLKQIEAAGGSDTHVNLVAMLDGIHMLEQVTVDAFGVLTPIPETRGGTWRFSVGPQVDPRYVALRTHGDDPFLGERNMGDPNELRGFISWARTRYPAQRYALIVWDHGGGWKGVCWDDSSRAANGETDALFMDEFTRALKGFFFDLVGFDACLMATIEVADQLLPFSKYLVASEESVSADGFPYDAWVAGLKANPGWSGAQLGARIVDDFHAYYSQPGAHRDDDHTLACLDQSKLQALVDTTSLFAADLAAAADDFVRHDDPMDNVEQRLSEDGLAAERFGDPNYMDLHDFGQRVCDDAAIPTGCDSCYKMRLPQLLAQSARLGTLIIAEQHGANHPRANGLSIYMPLVRTTAQPDIEASRGGFPYDYPESFCRRTDGGSPRVMYAENDDCLPFAGTDVESSAALLAPVQWPLVPAPGFRFPTNSNWDEFLQRFYHPVADNHIVGAVCPGELAPVLVVTDPACGNPVDEITVWPGCVVQFSGAGSSDADTPDLRPAHWMWDFDARRRACQVCTAPYEVGPGADPSIANDDMDAEHDCSKAPTDDEKEADSIAPSHVFNALGDYVVTLHVWDDNHTFSHHDTNPNASFVHIQTDRHASIVHVKEIDDMPNSRARFHVSSQLGTDTVDVTGPTTVLADLASLADPDGNGREQIETEMVRLNLTGLSGVFGPVTVRLRDPARHPFMRSLGEIEELANTTPGVLDLPPFTASGLASSFFNVFFEIEVQGPLGPVLLHNHVPKDMHTEITSKPPTDGPPYEAPDVIELYDENEQLMGTLDAGHHAPCLCDDGNPCTDDSCDPIFGCQHAPVADGTPCGDAGMECLNQGTCQSGVCQSGTPVVCTASDQCHDAGTCNPATGLCSNPAKPDGTPCDDGICCNGICVGGSDLTFDDGDACATSLEKGIWEHQIVLGYPSDPTVPLEIDSIEVPFQTTAGVPGDAVLEIKICDDYSEADNVDPCAGTLFYDYEYDLGPIPPGSYTFPLPIVDGVGNPTPLVMDDRAGGGVDPGDPAITMVFTWRTSPGGPILGGTGTISMFFACGPPSVGSSQTPFLWLDQNQDHVIRRVGGCVGGSTCDLRAPVAGDQSKWMVKLHGATSCPRLCSNQTDGTACDDGNACTRTDTCQSGACTGSNPVVCMASDQCHDAGMCNPATGLCSNPAKPDGTPCEDGNACTIEDECYAGSCALSSSRNCDDMNPCTDDGCNPATGCVYTPNNAACGDGNLCNGVAGCHNGHCVLGTPVNCDDGEFCTSDACDPPTGICVHTVLVCNDNNPCTDETCDEASDTCIYTPNDNNTCSDGNACTTNDTCSGGTCAGGPAPDCNDNNPCTDDSCSPLTGCVHTPGAPAALGDNLRAAKSGTMVTIQWADVGGLFNVYRGSHRMKQIPWYNHACLQSGLAGNSVNDAALSSPFETYYYLVSRKTNCGESILGFDSTGAAIPNLSPCP